MAAGFAPYTRSTTRHERWGLSDTTEALAAMIQMLDELDHDGLELACGISASPERDEDGTPTGSRYLTCWVEVSSGHELDPGG